MDKALTKAEIKALGNSVLTRMDKAFLSRIKSKSAVFWGDEREVDGEKLTDFKLGTFVFYLKKKGMFYEIAVNWVRGYMNYDKCTKFPVFHIESIDVEYITRKYGPFLEKCDLYKQGSEEIREINKFVAENLNDKTIYV